MESIFCCKRCGNVATDGFVFCPYCGTRLEPFLEWKTSLEKDLEKIKRLHQRHYLLRLSVLANKLNLLDEELEALLRK